MKPINPVLIYEDEFKEIVQYLPVFLHFSNKCQSYEKYEIYVQKMMPKHIKEDLSFYDIKDWSVNLFSAALIVKQAFYFYGLVLDIEYCQWMFRKKNREEGINFEELSFENLVLMLAKHLGAEKFYFLKGQLITKDFNMFLSLQFGLEDSPEKQDFKKSISEVLEPDFLILDLNCKSGRKAANVYAKSIKDEKPKVSIGIIKKIQKARKNL